MSLLTRLSTSTFSRLPTRLAATTTSTITSRRFATIVTAQQPESKGAPGPFADPLAETATASIRPHHVVVSISGRDKSGIVKSVSSAVTEQGANLEESKMAILGGDFAMILYISMKQSEDADKLANQLRLGLPSFSISVRETTAPSSTSQLGSNVWVLTLEGPDHPGIVATLSEALAVNGCNVREMDTETTMAPFAGYELFKVSGKVSVDESKLNDLSQALNKVEEQFGTTISLIQEA